MPHAESPQPQPEKLFVNDGPLAPEQIGILRPTPVETPLEDVRRRYNEDGYVFLKRLIPRADVLKAREEYFKLLSPSGVLTPGSEPVDGIFDLTKDKLDFPGIGAGQADANGKPTGAHPEVADQFVDLALKAHTEEWYKEVFCKHPALLDYVAKFTGWGSDTLGLRRTLLRNNTPGNKAIGVHYDQIFLRHGEDTAITAWVPMGDVSRQGGGLIYLERGMTLGSEMEEAFTAKAKASGLTEEEVKNAFNANMMSGGLLADGPAEFGQRHSRRWLVTAYEAGDVVLHNAYMIHASTINHDPENKIRLGTDPRFVNSSRSWDTRWNNDYRFGDGHVSRFYAKSVIDERILAHLKKEADEMIVDWRACGRSILKLADSHQAYKAFIRHLVQTPEAVYSFVAEGDPPRLKAIPYTAFCPRW